MCLLMKIYIIHKASGNFISVGNDYLITMPTISSLWALENTRRIILIFRRAETPKCTTATRTISTTQSTIWPIPIWCTPYLRKIRKISGVIFQKT